ncbi:hypothetical protein PCAU_0722 [Pseudomonas chlororaphis subsp. aurantiaca]|nr:hypothetical protein PCAU_0722 [Pseudomonas chlororaphis subsp. aurantiaca]
MKLIGGHGRQAGEGAGAEGEKGSAATECMHENSLSAVRRYWVPACVKPSDSSFYCLVRPVNNFYTYWGCGKFQAPTPKLRANTPVA